MANNEFAKALFGCFAQIAENEKNKAISSRDYGLAVLATLCEGVSKGVVTSLET